ncbi:MAG: RDD family protein [Nitrosopumilus sp.]|nr:RDD family protein [Nitrosopumilus sp.]MBT4536099.1 RDD family protein [Nitrosopumilus sp.]MBT4955679.1 RDD family protein [Nitrosopumilus sp.]MBT6083056.1 RDD family protein [Nitrosopumilus sp.]MBT6807792.1 RDD family protein [Nitrosopumilus sp.]
MNDTDDHTSSKIILAKWKDRFFAWIVDFIIISAISTLVIFISFQSLDHELENFIMNDGTYVPTSIMFFLYWIILEYKTGQTIGKKMFNLKITNIHGEKPNLKEVMISSLGKSFILPIDVVLGWMLTNEKRQRIFNKLGETLVVKIKESDNTANIKYIKD